MTEAEMRTVLAAAVKAIGSLRSAAKVWDVSPAYLSDCLNGRRSPGPAVLNPLGYERRVSIRYVKIGDDTA